jgi:CheY-like chemotaxis protein
MNSATVDRAPDANRILVVEDDDDVRSVLQELLAEEGYSTAGMSNGRVALDWLRSSPDAPSLILLDLMMPQMDGWEFLVRLDQEETLRRIPVAIMSAHPSVRNALDDPAAPLGSFFLLPKPIDLKRLLAIIDTVVPAPNAPMSA